MKERGELVDLVEEFDDQHGALEDAEVFLELGEEADDDSVVNDAAEVVKSVRPVVERLELRRMFGGE